MQRRYVSIIAIIVLGTLISPGCLWAPNLDRLKKEIEAQIPEAHFDKEVAFTLGPVSIGLARIATRFIPETKEARGYLKEIRKIELAIYETESLPSLADLRLPKRLRKLAERENWEIAAKVRKDDEVVWVLYHEDGKRIDSLYVVVLDDENLILVKIKGHLENIVLRGLREADVIPEA